MPEHPVLGRTHYTVGLIKGGVAPNVIPFEAEAEVMFRTVADVEGLARADDAARRRSSRSKKSSTCRR